ncbi:hypothetical protein [Pseudomonas anguilliseptica]|uniref:hypothetical protein n=1 Tax=Pseudomonas anguilliseptica TaxID=53406 RepID=UPI0022AFF971|nr:hypothetical protein [Pseudomonas anguilliseptica]MCZ4323240.1 hypothetical protein [Pseudomonas anguilliseptica]
MSQNRSKNKEFYEARESSILILIDKQLKKIPHGLTFDDITALAKHLAPKANIHWATLLRNKRYRDHLDTFLLKHSIKTNNPNHSKSVPIEITRRELAISNLKSEIARLESYIKSNIPNTSPPLITQEEIAPIDCQKILKSFDLTCSALDSLLKYTQSIGIKINENGEIIDSNSTTSLREIVVVGSNLTTAFSKWLKKRSSPSEDA